MLDASNFRALVGGTIQGFSKKNWISISFLSFENIRPRPSRLVDLEINFTSRVQFRPWLLVRELQYKEPER